jgi:hypothetical protein
MKHVFSQRIISGALVLWLSGVALLFCCGNMEAQAAETADSCPLAKKNNCSKQTARDGDAAAEDDLDFARFEKANQTLDCCSFLPKVFDKARKIEKNPEAALAAPTAKISASKFSIVLQSVKSKQTYQPVIRNRGSTYLKNRVFRI